MPLLLPQGLWTPAAVGGPTNFSPSDLGAALLRWYDASNTGSVTLSSGVSQWSDISGNAAHLTQATSGNRPAYTSGVSVDFEGGSTRSLTASGWPNGDYDIYVVLTTNTSNADFRTVFMGNSQVMIFYQGTNQFGLWNGGFGDSGYTLATGTKGLMRLQMTTAQSASLNMNGGKMTFDITTYGGSAASVVQVGNDPSNGRSVGKIHEIVVTSNLSSANHHKVEGYLAWKWGLEGSLPNGHPYKSAAPKVGDGVDLMWDYTYSGTGLLLSKTTNINDTAAFNSATSKQVALGTIGKSTGKWYIEIQAGASGTLVNTSVGIAKAVAYNSGYLGDSNNSVSQGISGTGWMVNNSFSGENIPSYTNNDILQLAIDLTNLRAWCNVNNGTWKGASSGSNPATNTNGFVIPSSGTWFPAVTCYQSGNAPFIIKKSLTYSPPSGFSQWN